MNFFAFLDLQFRETFQLGNGSVFDSIGGILPLVNVQTSP